MVVTENGSSDLQRRSLLLPSAPRRRRRIRRPPPPLNVNLFGKLGDDLLEEILIRLPNPRSSCRCKPVCRRWRSLLSNPSFNRRFGSHHQSKYQPAALFLHSHDPWSILSFLPVPDKARPDLRVLDCFKDLLLCGFVRPMEYTADGTENRIRNSELERSYLVCNPFTKQWIALPVAPQKPPSYFLLKAGLFCQPHSTSYNLVGDEAEAEAAAFVYSEYRFRVACICQCGLTLVVQVFCPESGEWTQRSFEGSTVNPSCNAVSWNGEFIWYHFPPTGLLRGLGIYAFDPFRPRMPLKSMGVPSPLKSKCSNFSVSQGAFHLILFEVKGRRNALAVWRLHENGEYWELQYETVFKTTTQSSLWGGYELKDFSVVDLHPEKPEVVYFKYLDGRVFSCNFRTGTGEPEFFCSISPHILETPWRAFQPRVTCWPTPIPRYDDGSYNCWVQNSSSATLPSAIEECQALVEQTPRGRKNKRPAASHSNKPCSRRKQKVLKGCLCPVCNKKQIILCDTLKGKEPQALLDSCADDLLEDEKQSAEF